jgi:N-acetylmuramoyl-L-alanine amidase
LRRGTSGAPVRDLQKRLTEAGIAIPVDGEYGPKTEDAVRSFQERRGLRLDGICGPETWGALVESRFRLGDRLLSLRQPMLRGDDVTDLQRRLNALGFDAGREDGILGPETETAVRQFQRQAVLAADGICGPATHAALDRLGGLAAGSVASVRERESLRSPRRLEECRLFVMTDPELGELGGAVVQGLETTGANVVLDSSGADYSALTAEANRLDADAFLALLSASEGCTRCAYFANQTFRSEGGYNAATRLTAELRAVVDAVDTPIGRTYRLLRETRMAAVVCELVPEHAKPDDVAAAIVAGIRRALEEPPASTD